MDNQYHFDIINHADRLKSRFAIFKSVKATDLKWVTNRQNCPFKADTVLSPVRLIFGFIPFNPHMP